MFWKVIIVVALMLFPCVAYAETLTKVTDESKIDDFRLFNLSEDYIKSVGVQRFQPLSPNPEYIIVIKKQTPNKVLRSIVLQGDQVNQIVNDINTSHKLIATRSCDPLTDSFDVVVHYTKGLKDRTFTALYCPGTIDQASGIMIDPGISVQNFDNLFKQ
jgi:hypothetical protein